MTTEIIPFEQQFPVLAELGITKPVWNALKNSIYPGAADDSIIMAISYCQARGLDPLLKPVHLVPMSVKNAETGKYEFRDVVMPGVGLYRIQADRSGSYAGADEPEFGPNITTELSGVTVTYPEWCKYTVYKVINGDIRAFSAKEYWLENYATAGKDTQAPNAMWKKRPYGQISKCAESQALRKAWPEIGQSPTAEEMEGKEFITVDEPKLAVTQQTSQLLDCYTDDQFQANLKSWADLISSGKKSPEAIIATVSSKYTLSEEQKQQIKSVQEAK